MLLLSDMEKETIAEVGNISLGAAASALSSIIDRRVDITTPHVQVLTIDEIKKNYPVPCLLVETSYIRGLEGDNLLLIKQEDALAIAGLMLGSLVDTTLGEMELSANQEAMNQMMGSMATSMSEMFSEVIEITPPKLTTCELAEHELNGLQKNEQVVQVSFSIRVEGIIDSKLIQVIPLKFAKQMAVFLLSGGETTLGTDPGSLEKKEGPEPSYVGERDKTMIGKAEPQEKAFEPKPLSPGAMPFINMDQTGTVEKGPDAAYREKLEIVRGIPLEVTVVLGRTRVPLGVLFALDCGGLIDLAQLASEPVEVLINDKLIAKGEIVLVNDHFGVRVTEQLSGSN